MLKYKVDTGSDETDAHQYVQNHNDKVYKCGPR